MKCYPKEDELRDIFLCCKREGYIKKCEYCGAKWAVRGRSVVTSKGRFLCDLCISSLAYDGSDDESKQRGSNELVCASVVSDQSGDEEDSSGSDGSASIETTSSESGTSEGSDRISKSKASTTPRRKYATRSTTASNSKPKKRSRKSPIQRKAKRKYIDDEAEPTGLVLSFL